jgi:hypothetical protein
VGNLDRINGRFRHEDRLHERIIASPLALHGKVHAEREREDLFGAECATIAAFAGTCPRRINTHMTVPDAVLPDEGAGSPSESA